MNFKWSEVPLATRIPKFLNEGDFCNTSEGRYSMQNLELYSVVLSKWSLVAKNRQKMGREKKNSTNFKWSMVALATRIMKFLIQGDSCKTSKERQLMQNLELYSVVLSEWSPFGNNSKNRKKKYLGGISNKRTWQSQRKFPNFCTKETPERPPKNAIGCRILSSIQWWC